MSWNWELPEWPKFHYDFVQLAYREKQFLLRAGSSIACLKNISKEDYQRFLVEILTAEGLESSKIEGELLDRESLQSSIKRQFGLDATLRKGADREMKMAKLLNHVYETFDKPLTHEMLWQWHSILFDKSSSITDIGKYRTHMEPMQIVSNKYGSPLVFFEAPPSHRVFEEMTAFMSWFNCSNKSGSVLERAAVAHLYFESIHPFEDGNGRIGRILVEKILSQEFEKPVLLSISDILQKRKKEYYLELGKCNQTLHIQEWVDFFSNVILEAQKESVQLLYFLIEKSKIMTALYGQINSRQEKALLRMFEEGPKGFVGGLSAENYIVITKASRASATRDLTDLVQKGALLKTGELRHTRYWLNLSQKVTTFE